MLRRMLPTLVALAIGLAALGWGLWSLQRIFVQERDDARAGVAARRDALRQYAGEALALALARQLREREAAIASATQDPLVPADGLYLRHYGEQRLPRQWAVPRDEAAPATALYEALRDPARAVDAAEPESPWAERLRLRRSFFGAVRRHDGPATEAHFRELLAHRTRFVIDAAQDLPYMAALLDFFVAEGDPEPGLLRMLTRDGVLYRQGERMEGLQRTLLQRRARFSAPDLAFLGERVAALSRAGHAPVEDFRAALAEAPAPTLAVPETLAGPRLLDGGWYLEPRSAESVHGVAVDLEATLVAVTAEMQRRGLLGPQDRVEAAAGEGPRALTALALRVASPLWPRAERDLGRRFRLKTGLVATCGALAALLAALAVLTTARRQRYLELKSDFVSTVSHELRTPLASIRLQAETLERRLRDEPRARDYPTRIIRDVDGLAFLVENILSFNRLDKGRLTPRRRRVSLDDVLEPVREDALRHAPRALEFHVLGTEGVELDADPELLTLLFTNLARNAVQYNERDPVSITVRANGGGVVTFSDNGVGIPPAERERVFEDFRRAANPGGGRGSGLGLAICRRVMRVHGGGIRVADTGPSGTTFELRFGAS